MRRGRVILCKGAASFQDEMEGDPGEGVPGRADSRCGPESVQLELHMLVAWAGGPRDSRTPPGTGGQRYPQVRAADS